MRRRKGSNTNFLWGIFLTKYSPLQLSKVLLQARELNGIVEVAREPAGSRERS
jgi:hypothetical protein